MSFAGSGPFESNSQDKILGIFIITAIALAVYLFVVKYSYKANSVGKLNYFSILTQSYGIAEGADVSMKGISIGKINNIILTDQGLVKVELALKQEYSQFYTQGSQVEVQSTIGLDSVLSGVGLVFLTAGSDGRLLKEGTFIKALEPKSIKQMLDEWQVEQLAHQVTRIVANLDQVVTTLAKNQSQVTDTLVHTTELVSSLNNSAKEIPMLVEKLNGLLMNSNTLLGKVNNTYDNSRDHVTILLNNTTELSAQLIEVVKTVDKAAKMSPELINNLSSTSARINVLLAKLNNHWLLGHVEAKKIPAVIEVNDDELYKDKNN